VQKPGQVNGKAEVKVSFENFGEPEEITYLLVQQRAGWKIEDIRYKDGTSLSETLKSHTGTNQGGVNEVKVYLVALDDKGRMGRKIGCDDSLVPVTRRIKATAAPLRAALEELLSIPQDYAENPQLHNFWRGRNLRLKSVSIRARVATIHISGEGPFVAGVCDEPRITGQIEATARQFPSVKRVRVFVNGRTLAEAIR
ncbi:MAG TPA: GerMN domain-containing protein, partial [Pyrinomonadaceae bacterium]|jgi:spore germination protein GerM